MGCRGRLFVVLCFICMTLNGQNALTEKLSSAGFENISMGDTDDTVWIAFENRVHRNTYEGLEEMIRLLLDSRVMGKEVDLIVLKNRIPELKVHLSQKILADYYSGCTSVDELLKRIPITYNTDNYRKGKKGSKVLNSSAGKIDLVLYPRIALANYRLDKLYVVDISLAPALEMPLWPGAKFTGQVVFPVYNNLKGEVDYIRPGILALSQSVRLHDNVFGCLSAGNFTDDRMGVAVELNYRANKGYWGIGGKAGLTGSSTFYGGRWEVSDWKRVNFALKTFFYEPVYNLQFDLSLGQYIYGDRGGRFDCTRHFGEVSVGVYAMYSGREANGGFHFSIPLPGRKRFRNKNFPIRIMLPEYFDWEYEAQSGPDYMNRRLGRSYKTTNDEKDEYRFNPHFIKSNWMNN